MSKKILVLITVFLLLLITAIPVFAASSTWYTAYGTISSIDSNKFTITVDGGNIISKGVHQEYYYGDDLDVNVNNGTEYFQCLVGEIVFGDLGNGDYVKIVGLYDGTFTATRVTLKIDINP